MRRWGTKLFLALSVLVFALDLFLRGSLLEWGAKSPAIWAGEYHRLLSATFLHAGLSHLLFNMYALFMFGNVVESLVGSVRFCIVYLLGGAAGYIASLLVRPEALAVGASAAIFGLIGYTVHFRLRRLPKRYMRIDTELLQILGLNLLMGLLVPRIDWVAHVGGLLGGALAGSLVGLPSQDGRRSPPIMEMALAAVPFALMAVLVLNPLWVFSTAQAVSPALGAYVDHRYGSYVQPLWADAQVLMWIYDDGPVGGWQPVGSVLHVDTRRPAHLALFWRWEKGRGMAAAGLPYVVHWERLDPSGQIIDYRTNEGTAYTPDPDPTLVYARGSAPAAIGRWQVRLVVDGREVWRRRYDVMNGVEEGRRAEG